ncbi:hypothetical protein [Echinicola salinicaeni]|uniref:hypothetical protein n=1 Tax=Echinicola salinicaeni TaxID=2762757 RepID=UPI0016461813|nr:hypothetical protein [Echinicola salinicaeni]
MDKEQIIRITILVVALLLIGLGWCGYFLGKVSLTIVVLTSVGMVFSSIGMIQSVIREGDSD